MTTWRPALRACRVGKTRLCQHFVRRTPPSSTSPTVAADLLITEVVVDGRPVVLQVRTPARVLEQRPLAADFIRAALAHCQTTQVYHGSFHISR